MYIMHVVYTQIRLLATPPSFNVNAGSLRGLPPRKPAKRSVPTLVPTNAHGSTVLWYHRPRQYSSK